MRGYSLAVQADVRKRMSPPNRQAVAQISRELGIHQATLYKWRSTWRVQGDLVPASKKEPEGWSAADKFMVVVETAGFNSTELSSYCRERGLFQEQVDRWRQTAQDANAALAMAEQRVLEKRHQQDQKEIKQLKQDLRRKDKALAEAAALLIAAKKSRPSWERAGRTDDPGRSPEGP